jgi:hypothetical protein
MTQRRTRALPVAVLSFLLLALGLAGVGPDRAGHGGRRADTATAVVLSPVTGGLVLGAENRPEHPLFAGSPRGVGWTGTTAATVPTGLPRSVGRLGWWAPALAGLCLAAGGPESRRGRAPPLTVGT